MSDEIPTDLKYASTHEWARLEEDGTITVGITEHAQQMLGDLVYVQLPEIDTPVKVGDECAVVESVKAASDVYSPVSGKIVEINEILHDTPSAVNSDPYGDGWLFRLEAEHPDQLKDLLTAAEYNDQIAAEE